MAAHLRNETEGAGAVASFRDLDEGAVIGRGEHARRRFIIKIGGALVAYRQDGKRARVRLLIANSRNLADLISADEGVDLRHLCAQLLAIALDEATGDDEALGPSLGLQPRRFQNSVDRFLLGRLDEAAGIDDHRVGLSSIRRNLITGLLELAHHDLAVHQILRTAQTDKSDFHNATTSDM